MCDQDTTYAEEISCITAVVTQDPAQLRSAYSTTVHLIGRRGPWAGSEREEMEEVGLAGEGGGQYSAQESHTVTN